MVNIAQGKFLRKTKRDTGHPESLRLCIKKAIQGLVKTLEIMKIKESISLSSIRPICTARKRRLSSKM
jgi:hypothetical protein